MRILWVCQGVPKLSDGSLLIAYQLADFLSKRHTIDLVYLNTPDEKDACPGFLKNVFAVPFKADRSILRRIKNAFSLKPNLVAFYWSRKMEKEIYSLTKEGKYDIIIAMTMNMAQFVCRMGGVKKIVMPHDAEHLIYSQILLNSRGFINRLKAWLWLKKVCNYERRVYPLFDCCVVVSRKDKEAILNLSKKIKAEVLPSGVDTDFFKPTGKYTKEDILIFTGVMNTWSNVDAVTYFAREVFPLVKNIMPSVKFSIVGKRPAPRVSELAGRSISVTGEVPDVRPYLEEASVFVAPFRVGTGLKHKILEAMAMGVPVVSTSLGSNGIDIKNNENILIADTAKEFGEAILALFCDRTLREKIIKNAHTLIREKYIWKAIGSRFEEILNNIGG
jgi:sugar transferase (PEP-CTERM/EpsH1 system associated)